MTLPDGISNPGPLPGHAAFPRRSVTAIKLSLKCRSRALAAM